MSAKRLLLRGLAAGLLGIVWGCQSGDGAGGDSAGSDNDDFDGLLGGPGFGVPARSGEPAGTSDGIGFTPGFGAPPHAANTGTAAGSGASGFTPGFGSPPSGSGSRSPGGAPSSGGRRLSDLSPDEAEAFCDDLAEQFGDSTSSRDFACTITALAQSTRSYTSTGQPIVDAAACEAAFEACIESGGGEPTIIECNPDFLANAGSCDASIGEAEACFEAAVEVLDMFSCEAFSDPASAARVSGGLSAGAPECAALQARCPGLIDMGSTPGSPVTGGSGGSSGSGGSGGSDAPPGGRCENTCRWSGDGTCDDGGPGSSFEACDLGSDCDDCGPR